MHNHLWRRAVDRSQRHGKFLAQRPISGNASGPADKAEHGAEFDDSPVDWDDYDLIEELTVDQLRGIDAALMSLATAKPRKVAAMIGRTMGDSPAHVTGLPDYFYLERVRLLVESGELRALGDVDDLLRCEVLLP